MLFNSLEFLLFFPAVCLCYYVIPYRVRYLFLLACSYFFYMCWNPQYALLMLTSTVITYASGLLIDSADKVTDEKQRIRRKKLYVALSFVSNLAILFFFKYFDFAADSVVRILSMAGIEARVPAFDVILPVGISFYTFQALSYTVDVYRKDIYAERNFLKYALFVSFFPQLVAGPIERSKNLLIQINEKHKFEFERVRSGLLLMLYGYFQKVVLAEYLAVVVDSVYNTYTERTGFQLMIATIFFAFQIYCDFGSYSNIAIGAAKVMGFRLMENFNTPYFAVSVADFWRRWHISLSTWFRDYLYVPLGGNRRGRVRKWFNLMVVFLASGLWHGASLGRNERRIPDRRRLAASATGKSDEGTERGQDSVQPQILADADHIRPCGCQLDFLPGFISGGHFDPEINPRIWQHSLVYVGRQSEGHGFDAGNKKSACCVTADSACG